MLYHDMSLAKVVAICMEVIFSSTSCHRNGANNKLGHLPGCVTSQGSVITSPTANLKASDLDINIGSFLFTT